MGFLSPKSKDQVNAAIKNVRDLGANASDEDRQEAARAAQQAGSTGRSAKAAFDKSSGNK